jgi:NAD(P)-dependent dehydrogenase (short-subunit alcohol dehydrogenase family)
MGRKMCLIAAAEGAKVAVSARSEDFIRSVAEEIGAAGGQAIWVPTDVGDDEQCRRLARRTLDAFGRIDGLVNSARHRNPPATLAEGDLALWHANMDVTCFGALRMTQAVLPAMRRQQDGAIVNVSTISTVRPYPGEADYAVAKAALNGLTRQLAHELGPDNIRVNTARMGWLWGTSIQRFMTRKAAAENVPEEQLIRQVEATIPLRRIPPDEECAKSVLMLISDYARMVTGATLDINGGEYMAG